MTTTDSPIRLNCTTCHAKAGEKCKTRAGAHNLYCRARWNAYNKLRDAEQKLAEWNQLYGKAI
jgi:acyl-CoA-binding protein